MNKILRNFVAALTVLLTVTTTYASTNPTIRTDEGKTFIVDLNDWANLDVTVSIIDIKGEILQKDQFQSNSLQVKKYNLKNLPAGMYSLILENSTKKAIHSLKVNYNNVELNTETSKLFFKPIVMVKGNEIEMNHLALGRNVSVSVSDKEGTFFIKNFRNIASINKRFDVSNLPAGKYAITITDNQEYFTTEFTK